MKINQLKTGVIISYVQMVALVLIYIIYTPIMLNSLGADEYGIYQLTTSVTGYLSILSLGFNSAYVRFYYIHKVNNDDKSIAKLNGMFFTVFSALAVICIIVGFIFALNVESIFSASLTGEQIEKFQYLVYWVIIGVAVSFPASLFSSYIISHERYLYHRLLLLLKCVLNPIFSYPLLMLGFKSEAMVYVTVILSIIMDVLYIFYAVKKLKIRIDLKKLDMNILKNVSAFSGFIVLSLVVDQINWNVDNFLLGIFKGTTAVAIYGIAAQFNAVYLQFSTSISSVFVPRVNEIVAKSNDNKMLTHVFTAVGRIQFIVLSLVLSGIIFFGQSFINLWAGEQYKDAYIILLLLIIPVTIPLVQTLGIEIQRAKNLHKFRSIVYAVIAVINVIISIFLVQIWGGIGCAIGTCISLIVGNGLIMNIYYKRKVGLNIGYFWLNIAKILPSLVAPIIVGALIMNYAVLDNMFILFGFVCIFVLVFGVSMWLFGMNSEEKELFTKPLNKIFRRKSHD